VTLRDAAGADVATIASKSWKRAGQHAVSFDPLEVPDGIFRVDVLAIATGGRQAAASAPLAISRTLGSAVATRVVFSPNGDGFADRIGFSFELAARAQVRLRIMKQGKWVATPFVGPLELGSQSVEWDGFKRIGRLLDGEYEAVVEATDAIATSTLAVPFSSDTSPPKVKILQRSPLRLWLSEPATVTLRFGTRSMMFKAVASGAVRVPKAPKVGIVRVVAWDAAGNKSRPASRR
jgi:hypothetical protein